jgi:hypothetical protein
VGLLLADLWLPVPAKSKLGYVAAIGVGVIFLYSVFGVNLAPGEVKVRFWR